MDKRVLKKIFLQLFAFLASACAFLLIALVIMRGTVTRGSYISRSLDGGFYTEQYSALVSRLEELSPASGVDEEFFAAAADESEYRADVYGYIMRAFEGGDTSELKSDISERVKGRFYDKLIAYADGAGYEITDEVDDALSHLSEICAQYYSDNVCDMVSSHGFALLGSYARRINRAALPVAALLLAVIAISVFTVIRLCGAPGAYSRLAVSGLGCALMLVLIPAAAYAAGFPGRMFVMSRALTAFTASYAGGLLSVMLVCGAAIGVCSAAAAYIFRKKD